MRQHRRIATWKLITAVVGAGALSVPGSAAAMAAPAAGDPFISEIHYDNAGTDTGEAIEIEAPAEFDLTGWQIVLYNGSNGTVYDTRTLAGTVTAAGVVVAEYPANGIQNGSPDGVALVDPAGSVVEFLSYEGTLTAAGGPADGTTSVDIGVAEASDTPVGHSLQKVDGDWRQPAANSFGVRNGTGDPDPDPDPELGCDVTVTNSIAEVQGTGDSTPLAGTEVTVEGIVVADHRVGGYNGVYLQTAGTGGSRTAAAGTASDGIFVYLTSNPANHPGVAIGDRVRVTGNAGEYFGLTQVSIGARTDVQICDRDNPLPTPVALTLPLAAADRESVESMLVAPVGDFAVAEVYNTNRYGEVVLTAGDAPAVIPTDVAQPGSAQAEQIAADNRLNRILVDDGRTTNLADAGIAPPYVSPDQPLRVGDSVEAFGPSVLSYGFDEWRLQPTLPVGADTPASERTTFKVTNPRTDAPAAVGGDIRVASFNVLNYFVHFGGDARGAADEAALAKQEAKIVSAITALDAHVVGLQEIENSVRFAPGEPEKALIRLVGALNAADGAGTWDYVRSPADLPGAAQQDFISNAIIFKPAAVTPVGPSRSVDDESVWFNAREPIAQTFTADELTFTVVANHFKSKSTSTPPTGDNVDTGDGQGAYNGDRTRQAAALADFVDDLVADSGSDDVLLLGDFNSYTQEDPMRVLYDADYVNLNDTGRSTYVFAGESGSLDHALASPSLADRVTGADVWQINAVESYAFQYNGFPTFFDPGPFRASDHNPMVIGLDTGADGPTELQLLGINDFHGRLESVGTLDGQPVGGAAQVAGLVDQYRATNPNTVFVSAGDNIGASTFVSAIDDDNPTLDVLNAAGLDVTAVGNHEFDKGMADLTDRVIPRSDFPQLGANVYRDDERALPAYHVQEIGGIRVGYIGVVTEQTAVMVSPDGIAGITFRPAAAEADLVATQLKDGDESNGEADVVVLLTHEGAATENIDSPEALMSDPVFGPYTRTVPEIDVIFSGHTHQPYAFEVPVPGTDETRPVLQAEDYGKKLGRVVLQVDVEAGTVETDTVEIVDVVGAPVNQEVADIVAAAKANAEVLGQQPLGSITADITRAYTNGNEDRGKESVLGNFIADVQLAGTREPGRGGAQIAFMNPGGLRADLLYGEDGVITFAEAFSTQPFANDMVTRTYTGAQVKQVLEEQWQPAGASRPLLWLGVSEGFFYTYDPTLPQGERITSMTLNGQPVSPTGTYRVTVNSFLAAGGDNFTTLADGTDTSTTGDNDLTMLVAYFAENSPITADTESRSAVGQPEPTCDVTVTGTHDGGLIVKAEMTYCLESATVNGPVTVRPGATLIATDGAINGPLTANRPTAVSFTGTSVSGPLALLRATGAVTLTGVTIRGPLEVTGGDGGLRLDGADISGPVRLVNNKHDELPVVVAGNTIRGPLHCQGNSPMPVDEDRVNTVQGPVSGQCARL
ncbi:ExeM/NucH family extracellular endonuclease [Solwaraspora sp. WMMD937]|uniref:ExeM/NucH family extracellular endonuclease n=1 Tax=Solwaraspora sp. WMMD937 TaxID=3016090 RepID=UPI00249AD1DD|nr:ExeM/NucH family extracellular endonuclease [Solwaraspora sp. WMMD937]WFE22389.1 ExeM/NucH family extracellular endonuclease [Solwaraspora sp. WMMD937]